MSAIFSPCRRYRYRLDRDIGMFGPPVAFCLHNPSTAGEDVDDPTSRRGIGFAARWQCSRLTYINPWAGIATSPADLWAMDDPVGPENDHHIAAVANEVAAGGGWIVLAWGAVSPPVKVRAAAMARLRLVERVIRDAGCDVRCLGLTKAGMPKHPLYLPNDTEPTALRNREGG